MVVRETATGAPLKLVADKLAISIQAVSTYLWRARKKLGLASRVALAEVVLGRRRSITGILSALSTRLTLAELSVTEAVLQGRSNAHIASVRGTSLRTVENQVSRLLLKLGAGSRSELIARLYSSEVQVGKAPMEAESASAVHADSVLFPNTTRRHPEGL